MTAEWLTVTNLLYILESAGDTLRRLCIVGIEVNGRSAVNAAVNLAVFENCLTVNIYNAGSSNGVCIHKTIIEYENGNCKPIRKNLIKYAQILEVPVEYLRDDRYNTPLEVFNKPSPEVLGMDAERRKAVSPNAISEMEFIKERGTALLAGGELSEDLKEELFRCMYVAYLEGKGKMND